MNVTVLRETENLNPRRMMRDTYLHTYKYSVTNYIDSYACVFGYKCMCSLCATIGSGCAIMMGSSTYVGMITVGRAEQSWKAPCDMVTKEVCRDRLVRARLPRRESYKLRREEENRCQQPGLL